MQRSGKLTLLLLTAGALVLTSCQSRGSKENRLYVARPVERLYLNGTEELRKRDYPNAIASFNEVERQHPYSEWAQRSTLMSAFASYESSRYDDAINTARRYISLHPGSDGAPYAYYIVAVSYFDQIMDVGRDQKTTEYAKAALVDVQRRFPQSEYAKDAQLKIDMVNDQLAGKEMRVGRWYLRQNEHLPAINRFKTVVEEYETTSHTAEALHRLVEGYLSIGLNGQAQVAAAVLGYNYPESKWYQRSYRLMTSQGLNPDNVSEEQRKGWLSRIF